MGTGNLVVQADDVDVKERGIDLAFRRSYNSQSGHNVSNSDGSGASVFGNGWTNPFDARIAYNQATNVLSIYDIDGARYDWTSNGSGGWNPPAGLQGTTLTQNADQCGYQWTKKSGTTYLFYKPVAACGTAAGYYGRLAAIYGRNTNNAIVFNYTWKTTGSSIEDVASITVAHTDGQSLVLSFASFGPYTELSSITRPDGSQIVYSYDTSGNLLEVDRPGTNTISLLPETYVYSGGLLSAIGTPRETLSYRANGGITSDGELFSIAYSGANVASFTESGTMNFAPSDGTSTILQPAFPTAQFTWRVTAFLGFGTGTVSMVDTDGHSTNWTIDSLGRETMRSEWTGSQYLISRSTWNATNELTAAIDPRGYETDRSYDSNGNLTEVEEPTQNTSAGTLRPLSLYSYDQYNNVTSYCDAVSNSVGGRAWSATVPTSDTLCPSSGVTQAATYNYGDSAETFGQIISSTDGLGNVTTYQYNTSNEGGIDAGLITGVLSPAFAQVIGGTLSPSESYVYDGFGNITSVNNGVGTEAYSYDSLHRLTMETDADGVHAYRTYNPDGSILNEQSASQYQLTHGNGIELLTP
jgi:YD repeat-containing protein